MKNNTNPASGARACASGPRKSVKATTKSKLEQLRRNLYNVGMAMQEMLEVRPLKQLSTGNISPSQLRALRLVVFNEGIRVGRVAEALGNKPSSASLILDRLETRGYLERFSDLTDRRVQRLRVTTTGKALFEEAEMAINDKLVAALDGFDESQMTQLIFLTGALTRGLMVEESFFASLCFHCGVHASGNCALDMQYTCCPYLKVAEKS